MNVEETVLHILITALAKETVFTSGPFNDLSCLEEKPVSVEHKYTAVTPTHLGHR